MELNFSKMEGLGNDFILLNDRSGAIQKSIAYPELSKKLCSRNFGIGADGIILILDSNTADIRFRIYNSDGSEPQMCGNGMRCFAKYLYENHIIRKPKFQVETMAGTIVPELLFNETGQVTDVCVDMGEPILDPEKIPFNTDTPRAIGKKIKVNGSDVFITAVSMGNPHAVIFVDDVEKVDLETQGKAIENHELFPEKTNVEFIQIISKREIKMGVWERGAGKTLACGTGACAALVASHLNGKSKKRALVRLKGGDLFIHWDKGNNRIYKTGPANLVFEGTIQV